VAPLHDQQDYLDMMQARNWFKHTIL
jgi:hypothetical protein